MLAHERGVYTKDYYFIVRQSVYHTNPQEKPVRALEFCQKLLERKDSQLVVKKNLHKEARGRARAL